MLASGRRRVGAVAAQADGVGVTPAHELVVPSEGNAVAVLELLEGAPGTVGAAGAAVVVAVVAGHLKAAVAATGAGAVVLVAFDHLLHAVDMT